MTVFEVCIMAAMSLVMWAEAYLNFRDRRFVRCGLYAAIPLNGWVAFALRADGVLHWAPVTW